MQSGWNSTSTSEASDRSVTDLMFFGAGLAGPFFMVVVRDTGATTADPDVAGEQKALPSGVFHACDNRFFSPPYCCLRQCRTTTKASSAWWLSAASRVPSRTAEPGLCMLISTRFFCRHPVLAPETTQLRWPELQLVGARRRQLHHPRQHQPFDFVRKAGCNRENRRPAAQTSTVPKTRCTTPPSVQGAFGRSNWNHEG